jgi:GxxExxY protein
MTQEGGKAGRFSDGSGEILGACIEVHRHLGPGLLETIYEECLCQELHGLGIRFQRQVHLPVFYKGKELEVSYRLDLVVRNHTIVEIKAVENLLPIHEAQALTYLKLTGLPTALIVNFNVPVLRSGLRRLTNKFPSRLPAFL